MKPSRVCAQPGCPEYEPCPTHPKTRTPDNPERGTASQRGYGAKWAKYSAAYRIRHPYCVPCMKAHRETPATAVDHIKPVTGPSDPKFWRHSNHQSICTSCHSAKTRAEGRTQHPETTGAGGDVVFA